MENSDGANKIGERLDEGHESEKLDTTDGKQIAEESGLKPTPGIHANLHPDPNIAEEKTELSGSIHNDATESTHNALTSTITKLKIVKPSSQSKPITENENLDDKIEAATQTNEDPPGKTPMAVLDKEYERARTLISHLYDENRKLTRLTSKFEARFKEQLAEREEMNANSRREELDQVKTVYNARLKQLEQEKQFIRRMIAERKARLADSELDMTNVDDNFISFDDDPILATLNDIEKEWYMAMKSYKEDQQVHDPYTASLNEAVTSVCEKYAQKANSEESWLTFDERRCLESVRKASNNQYSTSLSQLTRLMAGNDGSQNLDRKRLFAPMFADDAPNSQLNGASLRYHHNELMASSNEMPEMVFNDAPMTSNMSWGQRREAFEGPPMMKRPMLDAPMFPSMGPRGNFGPPPPGGPMPLRPGPMFNERSGPGFGPRPRFQMPFPVISSRMARPMHRLRPPIGRPYIRPRF